MRLWIMSILLSLFLLACGSQESSESKTESTKLDPDSSAGQGQVVFQTYCAVCHAIEGDRSIVGPSLEGIATRAATRVEGMDAPVYLEESIMNPNAYLVEGFSEGTMPQNFARDLTLEEIDQLIAYLLTLK